jgi:hypothetical protein
MAKAHETRIATILHGRDDQALHSRGRPSADETQKRVAHLTCPRVHSSLREVDALRRTIPR